MPYATVTDLQDRLGDARLQQLTDIGDPPVGVINDAVALAALADATAEIDGYLVGRYTLPLADPPGVLKVHCCTIAHYRLLGDRADELSREQYKLAIAYLDRVGRGEILLVAPNAAPPAPGLGTVLFSPGAKVMGRDAYADG